MLTRLRFRNFKVWKDSGDIRLAPLTVLFGTNSAGKTSIPQLLLLLKQTAESPDRQRALHLGDGRTSVNLGTYQDIVHGRAIDSPLEVELDWQPTPPQPHLGFSVRIRANARHQPAIDQFEFVEYAAGDDHRVRARVGMRQRPDGQFDLIASGYDLAHEPGRPESLPAPDRFYGFPAETTASYPQSGFVADLVLTLEALLRGIYYLGPLRDAPRRRYDWSGDVPDHVGERGERTIEAILAAGDRPFDWPGHGATPLATLVAQRLQQMGMIHDFEVRPLAPHRSEYDVRVRTSPRLPFVGLTDVGLGVSQLLPIIVDAFSVPPDSIVIIEQPETHLHPKVQADLADLFIDAVRARENGRGRRCQFIVESHSEYFLRRLQRRIAEEQLASEDTALYFVGAASGEAAIEALDVDAFGNIRNWPAEFFGDEIGDLVARRDAQVRRSSRRGTQE